MIQFNLLPDVKLQYIKAARTKRLVISVAMLVSAAIVGIVLLLAMTVLVIQRNHINNLNKDITAASEELTGTNDINKVLTVQNQLMRLTSLHEEKPAAARLFGYIAQITPADVTFTSAKINFDETTIEITGDAPSVQEVNKFVDTIKFTTIEPEEEVEDPEAEPASAFSEVVLSSFARGDTAIAYTITFKYDPVLFDNTLDTKIKIPNNFITTRSEVEKPDELFRESEGAE